MCKKIMAKGDGSDMYGTVQGLQLVSNGATLGNILDGDILNVTDVSTFTFEAEVSRRVSGVMMTIRTGGKRWAKLEKVAQFRIV